MNESKITIIYDDGPNPAWVHWIIEGGEEVNLAKFRPVEPDETITDATPPSNQGDSDPAPSQAE